MKTAAINLQSAHVTRFAYTVNAPGIVIVTISFRQLFLLIFRAIAKSYPAGAGRERLRPEFFAPGLGKIQTVIMDIIYKTGIVPAPEQIIALYERAGLPRPITDKERIRKMYEHSNLVITAWHKKELAGVARSITDWVWSCYLADLAVDPAYKRSGIGKKLVELTREKLGGLSMLLLLSVPTAMEYYPKIGFVKEDRGFMINREK